MSGGWFETISTMASLNAAFEEELRRDGPAGVDRQRPSQLKEHKGPLLQKLRAQLLDGSYHCDAVLRHLIPKKKGGKRPIGVATVRDRVVQRAILRVLAPKAEHLFLDCSHAFRPRRSPHTALRQVQQYRDEGRLWVFEADIEDCFGSIDPGVFAQEMGHFCPDVRLQRLLLQLVESGVMEGGFVSPEKGLPQGSPLSPLLANIYLHPFDQAMTERGYRLVRYADDFVVLCVTEAETEEAADLVETLLAQRAMRLAPEKTECLHISSGLSFLGCEITETGIAPKPRAVQTLQRRLRSCNITHRHAPPQERQNALLAILRGWRQYYPGFGGLRLEHPALARAVLRVAAEHQEHEMLQRCRAYLQHHNEPLERGEAKMREDTQVTPLSPDEALISPLAAEIALFRHKLHHEPDNTQHAHQLASLYLQCQHPIQGHAVLEHSLQSGHNRPKRPIAWTPEGPAMTLTQAQKKQLLEWFAGRPGLYARAVSSLDGRILYETQTGHMGPVLLEEHLQGRIYLGSFLGEDDEQTRVAGWTIRQTKANTQRNLGREGFEEQSQESLQRWTLQCISYCERLGLMGLVEDTGGLSRRVWLIWKEPVPIAMAHQFLNTIIEGGPSLPEGLVAVAFPDTDEQEQPTPLPLGGHHHTGRRSVFLHPIDGTPIPVSQALSYVLPIDRKTTESLWKRQVALENEHDISLRYPQVHRLAASCLVLRKLIDKLLVTHELDHMERVSMLYTFGYLGEEGERFLHAAMSLTPGYKAKEVERWISKRRAFPISCARLREKHSALIDNTSCQCVFKRIPPRRYATPLLHVLPPRDVFPRWSQDKTDKQRAPHTQQETKEQVELSELIRKGLELHKQEQGLKASMQRHKALLRAAMDQQNTQHLVSKRGTITWSRRADGQEEWHFAPTPEAHKGHEGR